jgi:hypothetical protein
MLAYLRSLTRLALTLLALLGAFARRARNKRGCHDSVGMSADGAAGTESGSVLRANGAAGVLGLDFWGRLREDLSLIRCGDGEHAKIAYIRVELNSSLTQCLLRTPLH